MKKSTGASEAKHERDISGKGEDNWNKQYDYIKEKCDF